MKYLIMIEGRIVDQTITDNIVAAARRGKITEAGKKLRLVPDSWATNRRDKSKRRFSGRGSVKKKDCLMLKSLLSVPAT